MRVLIVEDEIMARQSLARALTQHFPDLHIVGTTGSVRETVGWLRTPGNVADVIFMDVELSDGDCFEIFRQIDVTARVIMTTAYDSYAVRAFEVVAPPRGRKQRYVVRFNDRIVPVKTADIAYFYSEEKNTYLVTVDNNRYVMDLSLDILSEELDERNFFRISRNCIVSMQAIASVVKYLGNRLKIIARPHPDFEMVVSRSRVDDFLRWLEGEE